MTVRLKPLRKTESPTAMLDDHMWTGPREHLLSGKCVACVMGIKFAGQLWRAHRERLLHEWREGFGFSHPMYAECVYDGAELPEVAPVPGDDYALETLFWKATQRSLAAERKARKSSETTTARSTDTAAEPMGDDH